MTACFERATCSYQYQDVFSIVKPSGGLISTFWVILNCKSPGSIQLITPIVELDGGPLDYEIDAHFVNGVVIVVCHSSKRHITTLPKFTPQKFNQEFSYDEIGVTEVNILFMVLQHYKTKHKSNCILIHYFHQM